MPTTEINTLGAEAPKVTSNSGRRPRARAAAIQAERAEGLTTDRPRPPTGGRVHMISIDCGRDEWLHLAAVMDYHDRDVIGTRACFAWKSSGG